MSPAPGRTHADGRDARDHPLRILLLSNMWPSPEDPSFGGFVSRHVDALRAEGADVTVVANDRRQRGTVANMRKYASLLRRGRAAARPGSFDLVCGHFLYPTAVVAHVAAARAGTPYVLVAHGTDARSLTRRDPVAAACRRALKRAALVVTVSDDLARRLRTDLALPASVPSAVVNMGVDAERFRPDPTARARLGIGEGDRLLLFVGNLIPDKGVDVLLEAFAALRRQSKADRLAIVGSGPLKETLRAQAEGHAAAGDGHPATNAVDFLGTLPHEELPTWMAAADVLVLPSRREGLGLVLLEAMACGTPCVASAVGGIPEILTDSCGRLVSPDDSDALAAAIAHVLEAGKDRYGAACREQALHHTIQSQARVFLDSVDQVIP